MRMVRGFYNEQNNTVNVIHYDTNSIVSLDCGKWESGLRTTPNSQAVDGLRKDRQYEYYLARVEADLIGEDINRMQSEIQSDTFRLEEQNKQISLVRAEQAEKQQIRDDLRAELATNKDFLAKDEQEKKLHLLENKKEEMLGEREILQKSIDAAKVQLKKLLEVKDVDDSVKIYYECLCKKDKDINLADMKDTLLYVITYKNEMRDMDYDIRIIHSDGNYSLYSKVCEEKSGGETQTPFYVTVAASFVQLYKNNIGGEATGLVLFDEAFNNMDDERIGGVLEFLRRLPLQILIAAPPDKIQYISPFVEETLLVMTDEKVSFVERYINGAV